MAENPPEESNQLAIPEKLKPLEEVLQSVPESQREYAIEMIMSLTEYSGPLPPPEMVREFEDILPGAADRIFRMAEQQQNHIHSIENRLVDADIVSQKGAQSALFMLAMVALVGGIALIALGRDLAGFATLAVLMGAIGTIYGRRQAQKKKIDSEAKELNKSESG